jgi:hypothetical protein
MKSFICLLVLSSSAFAKVETTKTPDQFCQSSKEYITSFRYLEAQKAFSLKKDEMMRIADATSKGCNGAAKRFIEVNDLLIKAGLETSDSLKVAMKVSNKSDLVAETFITIFKETFLKDYLDLDIKTALDFSLKLALETEGNTSMIKNDFQKIVKFCLEQKGLDLSGPKCSDLAAKVAIVGTKFNLEMASAFLNHYDFLTEKDGGDLATYKSVEMSLNLIEAGPLSVTNFKDAYKFAMSKSGLDLGKKEAINYAELMAKRSVLESRSK